VRIAHRPGAVERKPRAVAVGSFDGVHRGHQAVLAAARATGLAPTVITFDPHPRIALGNRVDLLTTLARRLELIGEQGIETTLVAAFTSELQKLEPEEFAERYLRAIGAEAVVAGEDFRFGVRRSGDLALLERLGLQVVVPDEVEGVSSTAIRAALVEGDVVGAAEMLGRPFELDGAVVAGDQRGGTLGYPTANLLLEPDLAVPRFGIYAGSARGHRAAVSIGTNPHYGGTERRIEPYLLDFEGDLYGHRLVVELWQRLRDEAVFDSEEELVAQIARDVEATRDARPPTATTQRRGQAEA
jgi:riboflavin kinase / FMN adenylyltransferase